MLETDGNNKIDVTAVKIFDDGIELGELKNLMGITQEKQRSQLRIGFNDLSYSVYHNGKGTFISTLNIYVL